MSTLFNQAISKRYDELAGQQCCLSCGGAINFANIEPGFTCADLGSGKGYDVLRMATMAGEQGFAWGIDISGKMIETARQNANSLKLKNTAFIESELENISLENNSVDVVISNCTINHSLKQNLVYKEIYRILKKGGSFVISDIYALERVPESFRNNPEMVAQCWAGAVLKEEYVDNICKAGFAKFEFIEESNPYEKGEIKVCSFTLMGKK